RPRSLRRPAPRPSRGCGSRRAPRFPLERCCAPWAAPSCHPHRGRPLSRRHSSPADYPLSLLMTLLAVALLARLGPVALLVLALALRDLRRDRALPAARGDIALQGRLGGDAL